MNVTSRHTPVGTIQVRVSGELDLATADQLREAITDAIGTAGVREVFVDLAEVTFCDSSGLTVLDEGYGAATQQQVRFRVKDPQPAVARVLDIVGLLACLTAP